MKVEFVKPDIHNPFIQAAHEVLEAELGDDLERGKLGLKRSAYTTDEVTALVVVAGAVTGMVLYSMSEDTAREIVAHMLREPFPTFDALAHSGIGELGSVITGRAGMLLAQAGYPSNMTPPALILGKGTMITTLDLNRLIFPLETRFGSIDMQVAVRAAQAPIRVVAA